MRQLRLHLRDLDWGEQMSVLAEPLLEVDLRHGRVHIIHWMVGMIAEQTRRRRRTITMSVRRCVLARLTTGSDNSLRLEQLVSWHPFAICVAFPDNDGFVV